MGSLVLHAVQSLIRLLHQNSISFDVAWEKAQQLSRNPRDLNPYDRTSMPHVRLNADYWDIRCAPMGNQLLHGVPSDNRANDTQLETQIVSRHKSL